MNEVILIFLMLLFILTVLSALGGGIRFKENFYDELYFDENGFNFEAPFANDAFVKSYSSNTQPEDAEDTVVAAAPAPAVADVVQQERPNENLMGFDGNMMNFGEVTAKDFENVIPVNMNTPVSVESSVVEPFDGELYAPF